LGVLVAKSFRVSVIFGFKVLMQIKQVTDAYVATIVGALVGCEIVMLIVFNALNMTDAELVSNGNNTVVWTCNTSNGFNAWMGVNIGLFAVVMLAGAVVAFRTRSVPSAFNESSHILLSLQIVIFMLIILAPLDWALVNNSPEASVVIQGGGQLVLALFLVLSNFAPKVYYIVAGRADDKSMIFASGTGNQSKASSNHSSASGASSRSNTNKQSPHTQGNGSESINDSGDTAGEHLELQSTAPNPNRSSKNQL